MSLKHVVGIDHVVVMVEDLDAAADNWKRLGFTVSPRGTHSAKLGSGNYTIMFGDDYIELLGVIKETDHNVPMREFLARRGEGVERIAFTAVDSAAGAEEIRANGYAAVGPTDFERPVTMPDGSLSAAKFRIFQWPVEEAPGGLRIFACQHKTRDTVWIPELMKHANGAKRLRQVLIATAEPAKAAEPVKPSRPRVTVSSPVERASGFPTHSNGLPDFSKMDVAQRLSYHRARLGLGD